MPIFSTHTAPADDISFEALRAERQAQFGVSIAYVKSQVGPGIEFANEAARAVVSPQGSWYQLSEMPEEFAGATGAGVGHRVLSPPQILDTLALWTALLEAVARGDAPFQKLSLYALYQGGSLRASEGLFVLDYAQDQPPFALGAWLPDTVPRFLKVCVQADSDPALALRYGLPTRGVQFFIVPNHTDNGSALLGTLAPAPGSADLSSRPVSSVAH